MTYNYHLRVDRSKWINGTNIGIRRSALTVMDGAGQPAGHCCMGLLAIDCGFRSQVMPPDGKGGYKPPGIISNMLTPGVLPISCKDAARFDIYGINDDPYLSQSVRERKLKAAGAKAGLRITFFGKLNGELD